MRAHSFTLLLFVILVCIGCKSDPSVSKEQASSVNTESSKDLKDMTAQELKEHFKDDPQVLEKIRQRQNSGGDLSDFYQSKNESGIPNPCSFVDAKFLASNLKASEGHVTEKQGKMSAGIAKTSRSCFWQWNNGGLVIQISTNPMPDDLPNYISKFLTTKKSFGDNNLDGEHKSKFIDFEGPGTMNIKHQESGRYYVSKGDDYLIMLMFQGKKKNYDRLVSKISSNILKSL